MGNRNCIWIKKYTWDPDLDSTSLKFSFNSQHLDTSVPVMKVPMHDQNFTDALR